jgi:hypothetical protein
MSVQHCFLFTIFQLYSWTQFYCLRKLKYSGKNRRTSKIWWKCLAQKLVSNTPNYVKRGWYLIDMTDVRDNVVLYFPLYNRKPYWIWLSSIWKTIWIYFFHFFSSTFLDKTYYRRSTLKIILFQACFILCLNQTCALLLCGIYIH